MPAHVYGPKLDPNQPLFYAHIDRVDPRDRASQIEPQDPEGETWEVIDLTLTHRPITIHVGDDLTVIRNALGVQLHTEANEDYYSLHIVHNSAL